MSFPGPIGRPFEVVDVDNVMTTRASSLGLPKGQFPQRIRIRDEENVPHWFELQQIEGGDAVYLSDRLKMVVHGD